ncbi:MAG: CotH kinase family protein [Clostridia bacterium]|nr:CotH kinase family protein [Clostridia bacterium]
MAKRMWITLLCALTLCAVLAALSSCDSPADTPTSEPAAETTTATDPPHTTVITAPLIPPEPPVGTKVNVRYTVSNPDGAILSGKTEQTVQYGTRGTVGVTLEVKEGYRFLGWSDGLEETSRSGDCPTADTVYTALIEYDTLGLPVVSLTTETMRDVSSKTEYIRGTIQIDGCADQYLLPKTDMEIRGRGNSSWHFAKKSYRLRLSEKQNLLGLGKDAEKSWVLLANHADQSLLRNHTTMEFARKLEGIDFMPSSTSVNLYLNGEYRGVYLLCEQIEVDSDRINISENPESLQTGYLLEMTHYAQDPKFTVSGILYEVKNDLSDNDSMREEQIAYIRTVMQRCYSAVQRGDEALVRALVDVDSVVDTYIVEELFKNKDDGWDSFYMYYDAGKANAKLTFGPIWDFDLTGGNTDNGGELHEGLWAGVSECITDNFWYIELMREEWFRTLVRDRWNELKSEIDRIPGRIIAEADAHTDAYARNFEKWPIFGHWINQQPPIIMSFTTYEQHYRHYAGWMQQRITWLNGVFNDPAYLTHDPVRYQ